jgi:hypothetical protein
VVTKFRAPEAYEVAYGTGAKTPPESELLLLVHKLQFVGVKLVPPDVFAEYPERTQPAPKVDDGGPDPASGAVRPKFEL